MDALARPAEEGAIPAASATQMPMIAGAIADGARVAAAVVRAALG